MAKGGKKKQKKKIGNRRNFAAQNFSLPSCPLVFLPSF